MMPHLAIWLESRSLMATLAKIEVSPLLTIFALEGTVWPCGRLDQPVNPFGLLAGIWIRAYPFQSRFRLNTRSAGLRTALEGWSRRFIANSNRTI